MRTTYRLAGSVWPLLALLALLAACGPADGNMDDGATGDAAGADAPRADTSADGGTTDAPPPLDASAGDAADDATPDAPASPDAAPDAPSGSVTAAQLLALTTNCTRVGGSPLYATDEGEASTIPLCQLQGAIFWNADMDIDCDGGRTAICRGDPAYQSETSATTSTGQPLDAATVPFFVIPLPRTGFDYSTHGIELGSVGAVIYRGQVIYGVFGDEGPSTIIGEASYALASMLGVDADPVTGGVDNGVTYIVFTGPSGVVMRNEDHAEATSVGQMRAAQLLADN